MVQKFGYRKETPSQTAGPYVHIGLDPATAGLEARMPELGRVIAGPATEGERICVEGTVHDVNGLPVKDAVIEVWQADADGRFAHPEEPRARELAPDFRGWGRVVPDLASGLFRFETVKPGPVPEPDGRRQAPHLSLWIVARGINIGLSTRLYFADEAEANAADAVLGRIEPHRRETLIAARQAAGPPAVWRFDIHLAGPRETVFFDV